MTFEQWHAANCHELRIRYGNEHLGAMKTEKYQTWLREQYEAEMAKADTTAGGREP